MKFFIFIHRLSKLLAYFTFIYLVLFRKNIKKNTHRVSKQLKPNGKLYRKEKYTHLG